LRPERIVAVPEAAAAWFRPVATAPATPYFLFVGTLEPRKNLLALVEAWREVRRHHPVELVLAGRRRTDFAALAEEPGLRIMGEVADETLPQLYSGALAFVYPSLYEGFGLPVLEAMQCGACVIASHAVAEAGGDAAVYADSPNELARAMSEAVARPEWRAEMGARSLERAREFSWARRGPGGFPPAWRSRSRAAVAGGAGAPGVSGRSAGAWPKLRGPHGAERATGGAQSAAAGGPVRGLRA
jgi:glycosyltransferase involved in cell wall biosynthesis